MAYSHLLIGLIAPSLSPSLHLPLQLEVVGIASLLQVVFLAIRLDRVVEWKWAVSEQVILFRHSAALLVSLADSVHPVISLAPGFLEWSGFLHYLSSPSTLPLDHPGAAGQQTS